MLITIIIACSKVRNCTIVEELRIRIEDALSKCNVTKILLNIDIFNNIFNARRAIRDRGNMGKDRYADPLIDPCDL